MRIVHNIILMLILLIQRSGKPGADLLRQSRSGLVFVCFVFCFFVVVFLNLRQISSDKVGLVVVHALRGHRHVQTVHLITVVKYKHKRSNCLCDHYEGYDNNGADNDGDVGQETSSP